ncbi:hypothetical protein [Nitrosomonas sp.]|nr:hypothetical protein [Nitrosomonas sp.]
MPENFAPGGGDETVTIGFSGVSPELFVLLFTEIVTLAEAP